MFADIIPLTRIPLSRPQAYTYRADTLGTALALGQAVTVPLYNRQVTGIVIALHDAPPQPSIAYKNISAIIDPLPLVSPTDIATFQETARYYYASPGLLLKHVLPAIPKRQTKKLAKGLAALPLAAVTCPFVARHDTTSSMAVGTPAARQQTYQTAIQQTLTAGKQVLILVPSVTEIPQTSRWIANVFPEIAMRTLAPNRSKTDELLDWRAIQSGAARIAIGTRRAVFASFQELGLIIVDEEDDISYKQWDMNPRYHAPTVASIKARHHGCTVLYGAPQPSVTGWVRLRQGKYAPVGNAPAATPVRLADMRAELRAKNYSSISYELEQAIIDAHTHNKQTLVLVNRRGSATFVLCRDCGHVMRCPNCAVPLAEYADARLRCTHCAFHTPAPVACPQCRSPRIKGFGAGVEKVEHELRERFPRLRLVRWDYKNTPKLAEVTRHYEASLPADIILTTQAAVRLSLPRLAVTAAIDADAALHIPVWQAHERGWTLLQTLVQRDGVTAILQTYNPEHPVLLRLQQHDTAGFYAHELKERRAFRYPPFVKMITLICRHDDKRMLAGEVNRVLRQLHGVLPANAVIGPIDPITPKKRGFWYRHIILKLAFSHNSATLENILKNLSTTWSIDVDPMT